MQSVEKDILVGHQESQILALPELAEDLYSLELNFSHWMWMVFVIPSGCTVVILLSDICSIIVSF